MKWDINGKEFQFLIGKQQEYENPNAEEEENILKEYIKDFKNKKFHIEHNSKNYSTLCYRDYDIIRFKYGSIGKWIEIFIVPKYKNKYIDNSLFNEQANTNQLYWHSSIKNIKDLKKFNDIVIEDIKFIDEEADK